MFHCTGSVMGQLKEEFVSRVGYEKGTPPTKSPILLVIPTLNLRPIDHALIGAKCGFDSCKLPSHSNFPFEI
ncbi:hypothetical protein F4804DRAFT_312697 [Jackrogersella minutella]|nr:hypothetical protein F4804DRAFT_312697 [Jackrogersella minutella]